MDIKTLKKEAGQKIKKIEKDKNALLTFLEKVDAIKAAPKDKKDKLAEKLEAWFDKAGIAGILS